MQMLRLCKQACSSILAGHQPSLRRSCDGVLPAPHPHTCAANPDRDQTLSAGTGAGKTYSLSSIQPNNIGMMPRAAAELFTHIGRDVGHMYTVTMSYVQIYMEMLQVGRSPRHLPRNS